jgi:hypothetical protein
MRHLIRGKLGQVIIGFVIVAAAAAVWLGVSRMSYPTVGGFADVPGNASSVQVDPATKRTQITLTADAASRLGVHTAAINAPAAGTAPAGGPAKLAMPTAALFYDDGGDTWAWVMSQPNVFERQHVTVVTIDGDTTTLSDGPSAGTQVVTQGGAELYGTEVGVGEE